LLIITHNVMARSGGAKRAYRRNALHSNAFGAIRAMLSPGASDD
jgi:hypothetical protein